MADSQNSYRGSPVNYVTSWPGIKNLDHDIEWFTFRVSHTKRLSKCFDQLVLIITQALAFSPVSSGFELTTTPQHFKNSRNAHSNMFLLKNNLIYMRKLLSVNNQTWNKHDRIREILFSPSAQPKRPPSLYVCFVNRLISSACAVAIS